MRPRPFILSASLFAAACGAASVHAQDAYPVRQLTFDPAQEGFASWSPDGATLVHSYLMNTDTGVVAGLWTIPAAGGTPRRLTTEIGEHPAWSPDGHYIVFDADSGHSIKLIASSGGHPIRLVPPAIPLTHGGQPRWSPDGTRIAFDSDSALWVLDVRTGAARTLMRRAGRMPVVGSWSPDGAAIYIVLWESGSRASSIVSVPLDGDPPREIATSHDRFRYPDISPDGELLAYAWCEGRACDLWVMPAAGGTPVRLTTHPALDEGPRWSPDGTKLAFTSTRADSFDIWVMSPDLDRLRRDVAAANARGGRASG
jgi:Tol biopolymer transport system component